MRPHKLTMKAFGPFAGETIVDFDFMGNDIYLISGDTGAGKTTIFDGIIYALYGTASGGARSGLGTEAFHSDYAKDGSHRDELRVELEFSNAGRTFTVARRMYWGKKGDAQKAAKESYLMENGNIIVNGKGREDKDDVTEKITEIIGLDADQFRRIIMLAQGEFQKFLTAKSDERGEILGKIYDNRQHQDFQLRIKAAANMLKTLSSGLVEDARTNLSVFVLPDDVTEEEGFALSPDNPMMTDTVERLIGRMEAKLASLVTELKACEKNRDGLIIEETNAKNANKQLDELDAKKRELEDEVKRKDSIDAIRERMRSAELAKDVLSFEVAMQKDTDALKASTEKIVKLEEEGRRIADQESVLASKKKAIDENNNRQLDELRKEYSGINKSLVLYDKLSECIGELRSAEGLVAKYTADADGIRKSLDSKLERQKTLDEELVRLQHAGDSQIQVAKRDLDDLTQRKAELADIETSAANIKKLMAEALSLESALADARAKELKAESAHLELNRALIEGQSGILAQKMREELKEREQVTCPVCGTVHTREDVEGFAAQHSEIPDKDAVDQAFDAWTRARNASNVAEKSCSEAVSSIALKKEALLESTGKLLSIADWDVIADGSALADAMNACADKYASAEAVYRKAIADKEAKDKAAGEKQSIAGEVALLEESLKKAEQALQESKIKATGAKTSADNWKNQLEGYPENKAAAQKLLEELTNRGKGLKQEIDNIDKDYQECIKAQALCKGNLDNERTVKLTAEQSKAASEKAFWEQLDKSSFESVEVYHNSLSPQGQLLDFEGISAWISRCKVGIDGYDKKIATLEASVKQLTSSTEGMQRTDMEELSGRLRAVTDELQAKQEVEKKLAADLRTDKAVYESLIENRELRDRYEKVFEKLEPLVKTADGKYAFSRYVLAGFFNRIVEHANIHLETMTDGEYCLVPKEDADGRSNTGLDLKVLNTITNRERETASLSGGQLFEASLSLALGLSDVVQMESASSIQIDSMFIDEGFGSLDGGRLDKSIEVLKHLLGGKRQIGIISHVSKLDECLPKKIHVIAGDHKSKGSTVRIETDA